jgi:hypothetical protein
MCLNGSSFKEKKHFFWIFWQYKSQKNNFGVLVLQIEKMRSNKKTYQIKHTQNPGENQVVCYYKIFDFEGLFFRKTKG